jgi:predicted alpha/beta-hydrolase family hydrolase
MLMTHGPNESAHLVVLAPGDSGRLEDAAPTLISQELAEAGFRVVRFGFPDCDSRDTAARDHLLAEQIRGAVAEHLGERQLILGGLSRGARVSASLLDSLGGVGLLGFAYPFHGREDPDTGGRERDLAALRAPALICQGTRDSHGNREQVRGYRLPEHIRVHWLEDANHALRPRERSGFTQAEQLVEACRVAADFIRALP